MCYLFQEVEFAVSNVQVHGGYVLHVGAVEGTLRVGDQMKCQIDEVHTRNELRPFRVGKNIRKSLELSPVGEKVGKP